ncbi:Quaternary ammonium compound-resistance protein QacC [compost metagenome]
MTYMTYLLLIVAIVSEVIATSALKATEGFTKLVPSVVTVLGYASAFYFLSLTLKTLPIGIAYATWSGLGIVLISLFGWVVYKESLNAPTIVGMALIIAGVVMVNVFSKAH